MPMLGLSLTPAGLANPKGTESKAAEEGLRAAEPLPHAALRVVMSDQCAWVDPLLGPAVDPLLGAPCISQVVASPGSDHEEPLDRPCATPSPCRRDAVAASAAAVTTTARRSLAKASSRPAYQAIVTRAVALINSYRATCETRMCVANLAKSWRHHRDELAKNKFFLRESLLLHLPYATGAPAEADDVAESTALDSAPIAAAAIDESRAVTKFMPPTLGGPCRCSPPCERAWSDTCHGSHGYHCCKEWAKVDGRKSYAEPLAVTKLVVTKPAVTKLVGNKPAVEKSCEQLGPFAWRDDKGYLVPLALARRKGYLVIENVVIENEQLGLFSWRDDKGYLVLENKIPKFGAPNHLYASRKSKLWRPCQLLATT